MILDKRDMSSMEVESMRVMVAKEIMTRAIDDAKANRMTGDMMAAVLAVVVLPPESDEIAALISEFRATMPAEVLEAFNESVDEICNPGRLH